MSHGANEVEVDIMLAHRGEEHAEAWAEQKAALLAQLRDMQGVVAIERRERPVQGAKGGTAEVIMTLATSGALAATVTAISSVLRAWIDRDKARDVKLRVGDTVLDARTIDAATLEKIAKQAKK